MELQIYSIENISDPRHGVYATRIRGRIGDQEFDLPSLSATPTDCKKAYKAGIVLNTAIYQHHVNQTHPNVRSITILGRQEAIKKEFRRFTKKFGLKITDMNFFYGSRPVSLEERMIMLRLQQELCTTFLSDIDLNDNPSIEVFKKRMRQLKALAENQIPCPTFNINTTQDVTAIVEAIIEAGFKRFNVIWGDIRYYANWIALAQAIYGKNIVCNVVAVNALKRREEPYLSNISLTSLFGVSSFGSGYLLFVPRPGKPEPKKWLYDDKTWCYRQSDKDADFCRAVSHNSLQGMLREYRKRVSDQTLLGGFIPDQARDEISRHQQGR